ncbi:MAG: DUF5620 domain-containing protein, partial [Ruminococcus sp.]|nr:DUF5620 domain-containing protein [Ruminococcus sp.]
MKTRLMAILTSIMLVVSFSGCNSKKNKEKNDSIKSMFDELTVSDSSESPSENTENIESTSTEPEPEHISPIESVTASYGVQITPNVNISRNDGENTHEIKLSDLMNEGDVVTSFTFIIYSDSGNIGTFKGGCGISVSADCPSATSEEWYQSPNFTSGTEGTYGEVTWNVPSEIQSYISSSGSIKFGYWWGNVKNIRLDTVVCNIKRTKELPVDGIADVSVNKTVSFNAENKIAGFNIAESIPEGTVPQAVTFNINTDGAFDKFTGAFGVTSSLGEY